MRSSSCVGGIGVSGCCECMDHRTCASAGRQGILVRVCFRPAPMKNNEHFARNPHHFFLGFAPDTGCQQACRMNLNLHFVCVFGHGPVAKSSDSMKISIWNVRGENTTGKTILPPTSSSTPLV